MRSVRSASSGFLSIVHFEGICISVNAGRLKILLSSGSGILRGQFRAKTHVHEALERTVGIISHKIDA